MTKAELTAKMHEAGAWLPGKTVKLDFGDDGSVPEELRQSVSRFKIA